MDVDAGAPAPAATLEPAAPETALVPAAPVRAALAFDPTCVACCNLRNGRSENAAHTCARSRAARAARDLAARAAERKAPAAQTEALAIFLDEFVRGSSSLLDLTSGGPARGLHAPPGPNGLLRGRHVPPALLPPHRPLTYPACRFPLSPALIRSSQSK